MSSILNPYISFKDNAREAMEFYKTVFGGELTLNTYGEAGVPHDPSENDHIMHAMLKTPSGFTLMGSDTPTGMQYQDGARISVSLSGEGDNEAELRGYFDKLANGGSVFVPLDKAPWSDIFGMVTDKYGIAWMVNIAGKQ